MSDETAFETLEKAINAYFAEVAPEVYVEGWVLATHKLSPELERESSSMVGLLTKEGQSFVTTRGILDVAMQADRDSVYAGADDDDE
jgi:hypothetical protein